MIDDEDEDSVVVYCRVSADDLTINKAVVWRTVKSLLSCKKQKTFLLLTDQEMTNPFRKKNHLLKFNLNVLSVLIRKHVVVDP